MRCNCPYCAGADSSPCENVESQAAMDRRCGEIEMLAGLMTWVQAGKYRSIVHRHTGTFRAVDESVCRHWDADTLDGLSFELAAGMGLPPLKGCGDCDPCCGGRPDQCAVGHIEPTAHCYECGGGHEPSGARSDCIKYWKMAASEAREALTELYGLVENGILVRDCSKDADPKWYLTAISLTQTLTKARTAIARATQGEGE